MLFINKTITERSMKKFIFSLVSILFLFSARSEAGILPTGLKCENLENPQVVDIANPRLSWINIAEEGERGQVQTAWEIRVAGDQGKTAERPGRFMEQRKS